MSEGPDISKKLSPLFRLALKTGAVEAVVSHIRRGECANGRDPAGLTPLMISAVNNHKESCLLLLELGADASLLSSGGRTAWELASDHGCSEIASLFAITPASVGAVDLLLADETPLPDSTSAIERGGALIPISHGVLGAATIYVSADMAALEREPSCLGNALGGYDDARIVADWIPDFATVTDISDAADCRSGVSMLCSGVTSLFFDEADTCDAVVERAENLTPAALVDSPSVKVTAFIEQVAPDATSTLILMETALGDSSLERDVANDVESAAAIHVIALAQEALPDENDMSGWLADEIVSVPMHDEGCILAARDMQVRISGHRRIRDEFDWSDTEFELPELAQLASGLDRDELGMLSHVIARGLSVGYVAAGALQWAVEADCGHVMADALQVVTRTLDDVGILVENEAFDFPPMEGSPHDDALDDLLDDIRAGLEKPRELAATFVNEARQHDLIKREDEERLGRRMDSALGALTRDLAQLNEEDWLRLFPPLCQGSDVVLQPTSDIDDGGYDVETAIVLNEPEVSRTSGVDFRSYVESLRNGAEEHGRDASVPRPKAELLAFLLGVAATMNDTVALAVTSSVALYEKARDQLVTANLRLAISLANNYRFRDVPLEDLIQEASIGLMRAAERFDFRRGFKFSTYATWWIKQGITRSLADTSRLIRVPVHQVEKINMIGRARRELAFGRAGEASVGEIADHLLLSQEQVRRIIRLDPSVVSIEECGTAQQPDTPEPSAIVDPDIDLLESACHSSLARTIKRMLGDLGKRERSVLISRFGIGGGDGATLDDVGRQFGVTRERIRQIESKALRRLRNPVRADVFAPYLSASTPPINTQEQE